MLVDTGLVDRLISTESVLDIVYLYITLRLSLTGKPGLQEWGRLPRECKAAGIVA